MFFLGHVGLSYVLDFSSHLVNFFGWMSQGDHSETLLLLALFYQSSPHYERATLSQATDRRANRSSLQGHVTLCVL